MYENERIYGCLKTLDSTMSRKKVKKIGVVFYLKMPKKSFKESCFCNENLK